MLARPRNQKEKVDYMSTRDKLEYQKNLRFIREAAESKAKLGSPALKLAKIQQESDLTKPVTTLGDKDNKVPPVKEPKSASETPKTRETSRVKDPIKDGDKGDNCLDVNLDDIDYARISEGRHHDDDLPPCDCSYPNTCRVCEPDSPKDPWTSEIDNDQSESSEEYEGDDDFPRGRDRGLWEDSVDPEEDEFDLETGRLVDRDEEGDDYGVEDAGELPMSRGHLREATKRQKDAKQSLNRHKIATKNKRTKTMKHKSNAALKKESAMTLGDVFLNELSTFNKDELPGSGDISKQMKDFDDLLQKFSKDALELHKKFEEEMKVDPAGGQTSPQMAPRIGERNRMLMVRAGVLRKLASACTSALSAVRAEG